ncbi:ArsR/SmtB family transcription factor [Marinicella sp. W31]|uniref:ArsR/SmtB family transcription factor n=1 Tax=Marinicella sp. W31 TaxID=3023713 RepID=UPI00375816DA
MDITEINQLLSNKTRLKILEWLKNPAEHFPPHKELGHFDDGVCVQYICEKAGLSQSTVSQYLIAMQKAGLIIPTRHGKWTYYKRNAANIQSYMQALAKKI